MGRAAAGPEPGSNAGAQESKSAAVAPSICVFDVNETLLDIEFIRERLWPGPAMRLSRFTDCPSRRWWRPISQAWRYK
jgi:hypothetical protein